MCYCPVTADCKSAVNECQLYSTAVFNLNAFVVYSFCSLSFSTFSSREKVAKSARHTRKKQSFAPYIMLTTPPYRIPQGTTIGCATCDYLLAMLSICKNKFMSCVATSLGRCKLVANNLSFVIRGGDNSLHELTASYGTNAQTIHYLYPHNKWLFSVVLSVPVLFGILPLLVESVMHVMPTEWERPLVVTLIFHCCSALFFTFVSMCK